MKSTILFIDVKVKIKMNVRYFAESEQKCIELFRAFNDGKLHLEHTGATPEKYDFDASGITKDGEKVSIELKRRNYHLSDDLKLVRDDDGNSFDGIFIESHKLLELWARYIAYGEITLYVNFLSDGKIALFNLGKITKFEKAKKKIQSKGYEGFEISTRVILSMDDAWIYDDNCQLIHKPQ